MNMIPRGCRALSSKRGPTVATRFPTKYNAVRSAWKQKILLPEGLVHNPAPAAPTAKETPALFVPKTDQRTIHKDAQAYPVAQMPRLTPERAPGPVLDEAAFREIQELRLSDPEKWTRKALAARFGVSEFVIGLASTPSPARDEEMQGRLATIQAGWSTKRTRARTHRQWRKQLWLRDA